MEFSSFAKLQFSTMSPQKTRLVANMVRGKAVGEAYRILSLEKVKPAAALLKLLRSAIANANQKGKSDPDRLFISKLTVDEGPRIKRYMPRAQGRADHVLKRTSHVFLALSEKRQTVAKASKKKTKKVGE